MLFPRPLRASVHTAVALFVASLLTSLPARAQNLEPLTVGRTRVAWSPANGLSLHVDGVPVVRKSTLYLVKAGWSGILLDQRVAPVKVEPWKPGADGTQTATVTLENADAVCTYRLSAAHRGEEGVPDFHVDTVTVNLAYRLKRDVPAEIEYAAGYLSAPVFNYSSHVVPHDKGSKTPNPYAVDLQGPPPAPGRTQIQNRLFPPFSELSFNTLLGGEDNNGYFSITFEGDAPPPVLFDARSEDQAWAREYPVFWMGIGSPAPPVRFADGERHATFTFKSGNFDNGGPDIVPKPAAPNPHTAEVTWSPRSQALAPVRPAAPLIIPRPKEAAFPKQPLYRLSPRSRLIYGDTTAGTQRAMGVFKRALQAQTGLDLPAVRGGTPRPGDVLFGVAGKADMAAFKITPPPTNPEGYAVRFSPLPVVIGRDQRGLLWGAQTLAQLITTDDNGNPALVPARVRDWPTLSIRGVHLFHGKDALPFHEKLIERVLSRFKMNTLVIQAEQVRWDADPDVAPSWAGTKEAISDEIRFARDRGMTVYPLVQSYGHMEWLFAREKNRKFAEDPEAPYAVNFTDPAAVGYLEAFDKEADELFDAPAFHIGLDEVTMRGRFPFRSKDRTFADLFTGAATHWRDFFKERGKETWMWADMALHPSEVAPCFGTAPTAADAAKVRAGLPKDLVMVDWQYGAQTEYPSLRLLKDAGFKKLIAATWFNPGNIQNFSRAAAKEKILGALQTTWAGYESKEAILDTPERKQFTAMVLAAEYFWNGGSGPAPDKLPYDAAEVFTKQWRTPTPADNRPRAGQVAEWPNANPSLSDWLPGRAEMQPRRYPTGITRLADGVEYQFNRSVWRLKPKLGGGGVSCVTLATPKSGTGAVSLLLTATLRADQNRRIGTIVVQETGGASREIPLIYGQNIGSTDDTQGMSDAPVAWRTETRAGQPFLLRSLRIAAASGQRITGITLRADAPETAPILVALTCLDK